MLELREIMGCLLLIPYEVAKLLEIQTKKKIFIWKTCNNALPIVTKLTRNKSLD